MSEEIVSTVEVNGECEITTTADAIQEAAGRLLTAERRLQKLREHPLIFVDPKISVAWWECLEEVYIADSNLHRLFVGGKPSKEQNVLYNQFRLMLIQGSKLKASA